MTSTPEEPRSLHAKGGTFDFHDGPAFAQAYLRTYYEQPPTEDETAVLEFLTEDFEHHPPAGKLLEVGCGPTVHHVLPFAGRVDEIHMADYLEENLDQVRLWRDAAEDAHDWSAYAALTLELEGQSGPAESIEERMRLTRGKLTRLLPCDLKKDTPAAHRGGYDLVGCFYCAEEVGIDLGEWRKVMARVVDYLRPGGTFYMAALAGMDSYEVRGPTGETVLYPCARIEEADVARCLESLGFARRSMRLRAAAIEHPDCGVTGTVLVAATRGA